MGLPLAEAVWPLQSRDILMQLVSGVHRACLAGLMLSFWRERSVHRARETVSGTTKLCWWQNGFAESTASLCLESFVSRLQNEFLDVEHGSAVSGELLWSVKDAQTRLGSWRRYYNEGRCGKAA